MGGVESPNREFRDILRIFLSFLDSLTLPQQKMQCVTYGYTALKCKLSIECDETSEIMVVFEVSAAKFSE
jgi:hypothetical protein